MSTPEVDGENSGTNISRKEWDRDLGLSPLKRAESGASIGIKLIKFKEFFDRVFWTDILFVAIFHHFPE